MLHETMSARAARHGATETNAVLPTIQSRSRRLDALAVRLSVSQRTGLESVASCPAPQPSPHRAVHAHVFRGLSADY